MITLLATVFAILGGINWFLVGAAQFDFVAWIFGGSHTLGARLVYLAIGLAALWLIGYLLRVRGRMGTKL